MTKRFATLAGIAALAGAPLLADFTYTETSTITGGAMMSMMKVVGVFSKQAREPIVATVSVNSQTITTVDFQKKQYSVVTFDEMKQMLEQMSQKMKEKQKDKPEMNFKVSGGATGKNKQVAGFDAKEFLMKMEMEGTDEKSGQKGGMSITTDMWVAQGVPGYQEVRKFYQRMAEKLNWTPGGNMFMANPDVSKGMAEIYKEMAKMDGVPVEQFITMGASGQPGAQPASGDAPPPQQPQAEQEKPSLGGALGGALGGRFGLGRKKKTEDAPAAQSGGSAPASGGGSGSLLEMTTVMGGFNSNPVDDSSFTPPAGFKKVESDIRKIR
jgi:hypothetical protein